MANSEQIKKTNRVPVWVFFVTFILFVFVSASFFFIDRLASATGLMDNGLADLLLLLRILLEGSS